PLVDGFRWGAGWEAQLSPNGEYVLHTGYFASILPHGRSAQPGIEAGRGEDAEYYFTPAFLRDRIGVAYSWWRWDDDEDRVSLDVVELDRSGEVVERRTFPVPGALAGLDVRADGKLVALIDKGNPSRFGGSQALVLDPDTGETVAEFALEPGSHSMGYDPTGTFLLYVDGTGTAHWQGRGQSGVLASGLIHADW
ncbi:MAG: hypothetical protein ACR2NL_10585, partial [Acidimicrobiia bacterium]